MDCVAVWSRNFNKIINRYEHTVTAQFYGHTHADEFQLFFDPEDPTRPTNVAYIGPSVTPYYGLNPTYRIYTVSESSGQVVDHETWYLDLVKANGNPGVEPEWEKLYSAKKALNLPSLSPESWRDLVNQMKEDPELFEKFYFYYHAGSAERPYCDPICKTRIMCNLVSAQSHNSKETCKDFSQTWSFFDVSTWFSD